jgi:hypothetical protein
MGLKVGKERVFSREVTALAPVDGGHVEEKFKAWFRVLDGKEIASYDHGTVRGVMEFLQRAIVKLDGVDGPDDKPAPYSDELRDQVIQLPYARLALVRAYFNGVGSAAEGN